MTVRKGASLEASTASPASTAAGAIVAALARAGTRLMFGVPGGGPNLDVVGPDADRYPASAGLTP
jgi:hypothetical protein